MSQFRDLVMSAIKDISEHGYDSENRIADWTGKIRQSVIAEATRVDKSASSLKDIFISQVDKGRMIDAHRDIPKFTIDRVRPHLRAELDRRIKASADLIRINKAETVERTLRRFQGWATSIPPGGSDTQKLREIAAGITAPLANQSFIERRVHIDQGHKLISNISDITAQNGGAIAAIWRSRYRQAGYNARKDHKDRDGKCYLIRGNWAQEQSFVKVSDAGYTDDIEMVGELPFCRCSYTYLYSLRKIPEDMLTVKGKEKVGL